MGGLALRPEPRPKARRRQRASSREAMSLGEQRSDLQGQPCTAHRPSRRGPYAAGWYRSRSVRSTENPN